MIKNLSPSVYSRHVQTDLEHFYWSLPNSLVINVFRYEWLNCFHEFLLEF
jgi:hypothetical protein